MRLNPVVANTKAKKGRLNMLKKEFKKNRVQSIYTIDLTQIEGDGSFPCPRCGALISPEDETEEVYTIVETKVANDELLELIISCCTCGTTLRVTGFQHIVGLAGE
ncbi:MAG: hypothetical protein N3D85_03660 [Candidatus Bathyarchaeota archaeon]|nr:hypothetical protein [Candidatus Bathyarchaeota archaeon]